MSLAITRKDLNERKLSLLFWVAGIFAFTLMIALFVKIAVSNDYSELMKALPKGVDAVFGNLSVISTPEGYLSGKYFNSMFPIMLSVLAIGIGASTLSREESSGTLEILLSSPIKRKTIVWQKALMMTITVFTACLSAWPAVYAAKLILGFTISLTNLLLMLIAAALCSMLFGLLALMITCIRHGRGLAIGVTTTVLAIMYFANTVSLLADSFKPFRYLSPFYYSDPYTLLIGKSPLWHFIPLIIPPIFVLVYSLRSFSSRDTGI